MTYARCSECGHAIQVEKVNNDVMMMWHGTHCGLAQAYFADEDIFETSDDLGEFNWRSHQGRDGRHLKAVDELEATGMSRERGALVRTALIG